MTIEQAYGPIIEAIYAEKEDDALALVAAGADPSETEILTVSGKPYVSSSALQLSIYRGYDRLSEALMSAGADVNFFCGSAKNSVLMAAVEKGNIKIARLLLEKGADPNHANCNGYTALMNATHKNDADMIALLFQFKCKTDARLNMPIDSKNHNMTALEMAQAGSHDSATDAIAAGIAYRAVKKKLAVSKPKRIFFK